MNLDAQDGRGSGPGFARWPETGIRQFEAAGGEARKHRNGRDARSPDKRIGDQFGIGFRKLNLARIDIGISQKNPFPVRVVMEPERFLFREIGEGEEQDDAEGKGNDPGEDFPSLESPSPQSVAGSRPAEMSTDYIRQLTGNRTRLQEKKTSIPGVGICTSILLRPPMSPPQAPLLTLMAGLATGEAIAGIAQIEPVLKWPNDLLLGGRKVVGILTEMTTIGQRIGHVAIGIGINVHQRREEFPEGVRESATSIDLAAGFRVDRGELVAALYNSLDRWYAGVCGDGPSMILQAARARTATLGKPVTVDTGTARWQGTAVG